MKMYKDLSELFSARENDDPDVLLAQIAAFFNEAGKLYRSGLITEEEFYLTTYYCSGTSLYEQLWKKKGVFVNQSQIPRVKAFKEAWTAWKKDGIIPVETWFKQCIRCNGSLEDAVEWVFKVIDVCKIPFCEFEAIPIADVGVFPNVMWRHDSREEWIIFTPQCLDDGGLLRDPAPQGKEYRLRFADGTIASLTVKTAEGNGPNDRYFTCVGTVSNYVEKQQLVEIETSSSGYLNLTFGRRAASEWKLISHTALTPIPHSKWARFNEVHFAFSMRRETEYRILRLPYLLGTTGDDSSPRGEENSALKQGKILKLY